MTLGSHQRCVGQTQSWVTPKPLIAALGGPEAFDLDPCGSDPQPWPCAKTSWTAGGLQRPWHGRIWLNPPFDRYEVGRWIERLAYHKLGGVALLHARTETEWFAHCWTHARAMLFLTGRLHFHYPDGRRAPANSGAPAVLIAFGLDAEKRLRRSGIAGRLVTEWQSLPDLTPLDMDVKVPRRRRRPPADLLLRPQQKELNDKMLPMQKHANRRWITS